MFHSFTLVLPHFTAVGKNLQQKKRLFGSDSHLQVFLQMLEVE